MPPFAGGLLLGLAGVVLHVFALVPVYGSLNLHFGMAMALLALMLYGPGPGLLAALLAGLSLAWVLDTPSLLPLLLLELGVIAVLVRRRFPLIIAAVAYWMLVGLPLYFLIARYGVDVPRDYLVVAVIKQVINGLFNAAIASAMAMVLSRFRWSSSHGRTSSLYKQVLSLSLVCIFLPALLLSLILTNRAVSTFAGELELRLSQRVVDYSLLLNSYLAEHRRVITLLAQGFDAGDATQLDDRMAAVHDLYPGFLTLLRADREGQVLFGVPATFYARLSAADDDERSVSDRLYFRRPRDTGQPFVSDALQGRGFGDDPIVAVSAPLYDDSGRFEGIVEGSLDLPNFGSLEARGRSREEAIVLLDRAGRVVYASAGLGLMPLTAFRPDMSQRYTSVPVPQLVIGQERYLYETDTTSLGWTVHALYRSDAINELIRRDMLLLGISLVILIGLFLLVSHVMARRLTRPIAELTRQVRLRRDEPIALPRDSIESHELGLLANALEEARQVSGDFQQRLAREVDSKTVELAAANRTLEQLAAEDELTGLLNRRGFYKQANAQLQLASREGLRIGLALIDIDHFKSVNDRFGHPAGDEVLRELSAALRRAFGRVSDIVGRMGGEEFAVMMVGGECPVHLERVEALRRSFGNGVIRIDSGQEVAVTISVGFFCSTPDRAESLGRLMKQVDDLLYQSKHGGRDRTTSKILPPDTPPSASG